MAALREAHFTTGEPGPGRSRPAKSTSRSSAKIPRINAIVAPNPKIFKLAEGFKFTEGPVWDRKTDYLLFSDPNSNTIYKYSTADDGSLDVFRATSGYEGADIAEYGQPGSNGLTLDPKVD